MMQLALMLMPEPKNIRFGGGVADSVFNPAVLLAVMIAGACVCLSSRKRALVAFLVAGILIPTDQVLVLGGIHLTMLRVLVLCGVTRMARTKLSTKQMIIPGGFKRIDWAVVVFAIFAALDGILLYRASSAIVFQFGQLLDVLGVYLLMRHLIRDAQDVVRALRVLAYVTAVVALVMSIEQLTGRNPYAILGGANAGWYDTVQVRDGKLRATGCFAHPIIAGSYGAMVLPMFAGLWWTNRKNRTTAAIGLVGAAVIAFASNSSTSFLGLGAGLIALCLWPLRDRMRPVRWGIALLLVSLHIVMKAPVWQLIARVDITGGSSSDHRYQILNQCILHFWDWALIGTKDYASWGWGLWDLGNQYVFVADTAGLIPLIAFLSIIVLGFKYIGRTRLASRCDRKQQLFAWALGASLFANVVAFFGISYFDQIIVAWYGLLAMITGVAVRPKKRITTVAEVSNDILPMKLDVAIASPSPPLERVGTRDLPQSREPW